MRVLFASAVVLSSLAVVPAAMAASMSTTGTVKNFVTGKSLTLSNGDTFALPQNFRDPGIKAGERVKVSYQRTGDRLQAEMVTPVH